MISVKIEEIAGGNDIKFTFDNLDTATDAEKEAFISMMEGLNMNENSDPHSETKTNSSSEYEDD